MTLVQEDAQDLARKEVAESWSVKRLQSGEQGAWRTAYQELWSIAHRVISRRVLSKASIDDLAQETLMVLHAQINKMTGERHIRVMTAIIAKSKAAHHLRDETAGKRDRRQEVSLDAAAEVQAAQPIAQSLLDLETALAKLESIDRALIEGHFIAGMKSHELAAKHGLNASTIRGRMKRAVDRLRGEFGLQLGAIVQVT